MPDTKTTAIGTHRKPKRKRGGQKGNQNARKHGFYSRSLGLDGAAEYWNITTLERIDPEMAVFRIKMKSVREHDPGNRRVLREASKLFARWMCVRYGFDNARGKQLKKWLRCLFEQDIDPAPQNKEMLQNESNLIEQFGLGKQNVLTKRIEDFPGQV